MSQEKDIPLFDGYQPKRQEPNRQGTNTPGYQPPETKAEVSPPPKRP